MKVPVFFTWFFLIPLSMLLFGIDVPQVSGQCQADQQSLLLQFKGSLTYNRSLSTKLADWISGKDCCTWSGVSCDGNGIGRVTGLDLSNESISDGLENSSLFGLLFLQSLNLAFNKFSTPLSAGFANLTSLTYLNLSNSGFVGQIPEQISQMTQLETLDLSVSSLLQDVRLTLENPNLEMLVRNLTRLRELHLDGVNISASGSRWAQALSSFLPNLEVLSLSDCCLSGPIDPSLANLPSLSIVQLSTNNFSISVPEFFANFSNLTLLRMSDCQLQGTVPGRIFQVPTLVILDLSINQLQGSLPEFGQNLSLEQLLLKNTNFSGTLPNSISNLEKLRRIELTACNFTGPVPSSVENLTQLEYLDFSANMFTGAIPSFRRSRNLSHVDFSHNQFSGEMSSDHWQGLENLAYVDLRHNSLGGNIPPSLLSITSLEQLQLGSNQFRGQIPKFSNPSSSLLDTLDLSSNNLEGPIPDSIFDLGRLDVLLLSSNKLNGTIQLEWIQKLGNLAKLDLSYNFLTVNASASNPIASSIPKMRTLRLASCNLKVIPDISNHSAIMNLDLSDNQITGLVPPWIWDIGSGSLLYLNLSHNQLSGSIDKTQNIPSLSILDIHANNLQGSFPMPPQTASYVDYSSNNFSSDIQTDVGSYLNYAVFFSLSNNSLTGQIPSSMCNATYLQVLDMSNNNLNGEIPHCLTESFPSLVVLNLRGNSFSGSFPGNFSDDCALRTLDLSRNKLEGFIPVSLANCHSLEVLDLGHNQINGTFPCVLKSIASLQVIVLRSNNFHDTISCSNKGTWPKLQILDIASNNFQGKLPKSFLTTWDAIKLDVNVSRGHLKYSPLWLSGLYYQDSVMVTVKGLEMELVKILTVFTSIDVSCNKFEGAIPETLGQLNALYILNLSHNALTGFIPPSLGSLYQLESLDLSVNNLSETIPQTLTALSFLSYLNVSYNRLIGTIPTSTQIQSFSSLSFEGNPGLCGPPLSRTCNNASPPNTESRHLDTKGYNWQFILPGIGYGIGAGAVVAPLLLSAEMNKWYDDLVDNFLLMCLPMLGFTYYTRNDWRSESDDEETSNDGDDYYYYYEEDRKGSTEIKGMYCVFCTKLDVTRRRVIHNPRCMCYVSSRVSSSDYSSSLSTSSSL